MKSPVKQISREQPIRLIEKASNFYLVKGKKILAIVTFVRMFGNNNRPEEAITVLMIEKWFSLVPNKGYGKLLIKKILEKYPKITDIYGDFGFMGLPNIKKVLIPLGYKMWYLGHPPETTAIDKKRLAGRVDFYKGQFPHTFVVGRKNGKLKGGEPSE